MIVVTILGVVIFVMHEGIDAGVRVNDQMERTNRLNVLGHDILARIERDIARSHRVFTESDQTRKLIARFNGNLSDELTDSLFPIVDSTGILGRDENGDRRTGNALLFAASIPPLSVDVSDEVSPENTVRIDLYRFVVYYLTEHPEQIDEKPQLELVRWTSRPVASHKQVVKFTDGTDRIRLLWELADIGVSALWDSTTDDIATAFYPLEPEELQVKGDDFVLATSSTYLVPRDPKSSTAGFLAHRRAGIAADATDAPGARVFSPADSASTPGFEVKMIGPASARQVLVNLTMVAHKPNQTPILLRRSVIVSARDL